MKPKIKNEIEVTSSILEEAMELVKNDKLTLEDYFKILNTTKKEVTKLSQKRDVSILDLLKSVLN